MLFYIILFAAILLVGIVVYCSNCSTKVKNAIFVLVSGGALVVVSAIRYDVGYDYSYVYAPMYEHMVATGFAGFLQGRHEVGYVLLEFITSLVSVNFQAIIVVTSILCIGLLFFGFCRYTPNAAIAVLLFLTWGYFFCSMNFVRQMIASGIVLFAVMSIKKRKLVAFLLLVLLATLFHKTALIMLPFYFLLQIKITKGVLLAYGGVTALLLLFTDKLIYFGVGLLFPWYLDEGLSFLSSSLSITTIIMPLAVFVIMFVFSDQLCKEDRTNSIYLSAAFFMLFFHVMSLKHSLLDRFVLFFAPVVMVGLSVLLSQLKASHPRYNKYVFTIPAVVLCLVSLLTMASQLSRDGHGVVPYQTVFSQPFYKEYSASLKQKGVQPEDGIYAELGKAYRPNGFADALAGPPETEPSTEDMPSLE